MKNVESLLSKLIERAKTYLPDFDQEKFRKAFEFAREAHKGQMRKSGEPYIIHPLETVKILMNFHADEDTLVSGLMHDVPEDTEKNLKDIEHEFGKKIAFLVGGITKISKVYYRQDMELRQVESLKKLLLHCAKDIRVILIKLADRLHNMRTLQYITNPHKRTRIAKETLEIYVPISNLLGIGEIKSEMEDLCFKFLYPKTYEQLAEDIKSTKFDYESYLKEIKKVVEDELSRQAIKATVSGRQKTLYSIYQKMRDEGKQLPEINDILAVRIVTESKDDCYKALGVIHSLFKPKPRSLKDYIAVPKVNGYRSLHTTVFGLDGMSTEFQIRTHKMHLDSEYGIAAHYFYKERKRWGNDFDEQMQKKAWWVKRILAFQKELSNNEDFLDTLRLDMFQDRIFTFTPKGDVIDLPKGATVLDFAYAIHSEIGNKAKQASIGGTSVKLFHELKTGDTIEIVTDPNQAGPRREWLNFVHTSIARNRIKESLGKASKDKKVQFGKSFLQKELSRVGKNVDSELTPKKSGFILKRFNFQNVDELLVAIAEGNLDPKLLVKALYAKQRSEEILGERMRTHSGVPEEAHYEAQIRVIILNKVGTLSQILTVLSKKNINLVRIKTKNRKNDIYEALLCIEVKSYDQLSKVFEDLEDLDCIISATRTFPRKRTFFLTWSFFTVLIWVGFPLLNHHVSLGGINRQFLSMIGIYAGIFMLCVAMISLRNLLLRTFPDLSHTGVYWVASFMLITIATIATMGELSFLSRPSYGILAGFLIVIILYIYLVVEYIKYRKGV